MESDVGRTQAKATSPDSVCDDIQASPLTPITPFPLCRLQF
jgi:hypothetical protein